MYPSRRFLCSPQRGSRHTRPCSLGIPGPGQSHDPPSRRPISIMDRVCGSAAAHRAGERSSAVACCCRALSCSGGCGLRAHCAHAASRSGKSNCIPNDEGWRMNIAVSLWPLHPRSEQLSCCCGERVVPPSLPLVGGRESKNGKLVGKPCGRRFRFDPVGACTRVWADARGSQGAWMRPLARHF